MASSLHTIDVGPLLGPGRRTIAVDSLVDVPDLDDLAFAKPAHVVLDVLGVDRGIRIVGTIDVDVTGECGRCLEEVRLPLHVEVDEPLALLEPGSEATDPLSETNVLLGERLDLADLVRQLVTTALPMGVLCSEECQGLCPQCGLNRNEGGCTCPPAHSSTLESDHGQS